MTLNNKNLASIVKTSQRNYKVLVGHKSIENLAAELKQLNVKLGIGVEHMLSRDIGNGKFDANNLYLFMRYTYEKKWSSYLRLGYNRINGIDNIGRNGLLCGLGVDYKLTYKSGAF